jgi:hypothetical protein
VTRIIHSQIDSLKKAVPGMEITVLSGTEDENIRSKGANLEVLKEINYLSKEDVSPQKIAIILNSIENALKKLSDDDTIIHAHNLNLGKNPALTFVISKMAEKGSMIFNHCHDFAEDGRPENLDFMNMIIEGFLDESLNDILYPKYPNYRYGILNKRDMDTLKSSGVSEERMEFLPNPVHFPEKTLDMDKNAIIKKLTGAYRINPELPFYTYPVRVIRRKNIGEFILFAMLFKDKANWLSTLPPQNPVEKVNYEKWKKFCASKRINVCFETGLKLSFDETMFLTDRCISTSVKEGFGMAFLEPWTFGIPVSGRNINYVTDDFKENGLRLEHLYDCIFAEGKDFSELTVNQQMDFIAKLKRNEKMANEFIEENRLLEKLFSKMPCEKIIENSKKIKKFYSLESYGKRLNGIYGKMFERAEEALAY